MNSMKFSPIAVYIFRAVALILLLLAASNCLAATPQNSSIPKSIHVVMDDNYPPYAFKDDQGQLKGIIVDQWSLWEKKTGIHVEITGMDWGEAQRRMQAGEYDVIDTIFRNEKRDKIYDFTKPYAVIPVPLFFHSDISGISGPGDAIGFMVAAKAGGNVLDVLIKHGVTNIVEYPSYEKIIEAARNGKVKVFTVDRPPALYFLNKMGIQNSFRETKPLYYGEFHRAVLKGQAGLLATVEKGFASIAKADYEEIDKRWMGSSISSTPYFRYVLYGTAVTAALVLMLIAWLWILNRAVSKKTRELKESEEHHRSILQTAMNGIWLADVRGCLIEVNKSYCQMSGYSEQELLTMSISDLEANESVDDTADRIQMIKERGELHFESRHRRKDGTVFDVEVRVKYQPANGGQYIAFLQDITERKRTEESIVNSNKLLQAIISNAPMRIFWKDTELRYLGCNHVFAMDAGVGCPDDLIGKDDYQLAWKDQAELYRTDDLSVIESGSPRLFYEEPQTKPKGNQRWLRSSKVPLHNEANEIIGVLGLYEDITERKQMEEELILFFDLVPDMVCIASSDGYFKKINKAWESTLGYSQEELLTTRFLYFIHPDDIQATMIEVEKQIAGESTINFTNRYRSKDGSYRWLEWKATPAKNKSVFFAAARDITERKQAEEILRKKDAEIEQFLYTVSHDLRSPLVTVKTFMGYLEKDMTDGNQKQLTQDIQFIHGAADKMKLMLDELSELSRIGRVETSQVRVSLRGVLTETLDILAGSIREQKLDIRLPDTDLMLFGDHQRLCQIWQNLIENAIKYSRDDSIPRMIELGVQQMSGETVFSVKDNGIGIDSRYQTKIFGIFDKLDPKSPGAGLGLSMVLRIVEKYGGRIWVESDGKDKGSCFLFTLPDAVVQN